MSEASEPPPPPDHSEPPPTTDNPVIWVLRVGAALCFAGWAWQHLYWEGPYNRVLWDERVFALMEKLGFTWDQIVGDGSGPGVLQVWNNRIGWIYVALSVVALTVRKKSYVQMTALGIGSFLLVIVSYCKYIASMRQPPMFIEHGGQMLMPIILISALVFGLRHRATIWIAIVAFWATFGGHGAYALGLWPTPGHFQGMVVVILHCSHETALVLLRIAGVLDYLICLAIFIPVLRKPAVLYGAVWGFVTALARPISGMSTEFHHFGADQFIHEAVLRAPHVAIPLALFLIYRTQKKTEEATPTEPAISTPPPQEAS